MSPIYSSVDIGPAHIIALNSYVSLAKYTPQYEWLLVGSTTPTCIIIFVWLSGLS